MSDEQASVTGNSATGVSEKQPRVMPRGRPFVKGQSGNKAGRSKSEIASYEQFRNLCRGYETKAVETLAANLDVEKNAVAAAKVLLEYARGKAPSAPDDLDALREASLPPMTARQVLALANSPEADDAPDDEES